MAPAFKSVRQAAVFALLLLLLLLLPMAMRGPLLPPRAQIYSSVAWRFGSYPYMHREFFREKGEIDIAFMGSSHVWYGIDTPFVQRKLSERLGRKADVETFGWFWPGFDALYFIMNDLLRERRVHMIVIGDEATSDALRPQTMSYRWFRYRDNEPDIAPLSLPQKFSYYAGAVLGVPRNLVGLVRDDLAPRAESRYKISIEWAENPASCLGALKIERGFDYSPDFIAAVPERSGPPPPVFLYSAMTRNEFQFTGPPLPELQLYFARKIAALAAQKHVQLVFLNFPGIASAGAPKVPERVCWPEVLNGQAMELGIAPAALFNGLPPGEQVKLFCDRDHFNRNGQEFFTPAITPALLDLYEATVAP